MNRSKRRLKFKLAALIIFSAIISVNLFPVIIFNWSGVAYDTNVTDPDTTADTPTTMTPRLAPMSTIIIEGAGYILKGHSDYLLFLNRIEISELQGTDYSELRSILEKTIANLEQASGTYRELYRRASSTPYNPVVIEKLKAFDYYGFQREMGLTPSVFSEVRGYLSTGNVDGIYYRISTRVDSILKRIYIIKGMVENGRFPDMSNVWRAGQDFSENFLFGQYVAEVFNKITGGCR